MSKVESTRITASQSFSEEEVTALETVLSTLRRGGDTKVLMRSTAMTNVARKVEAMRLRVAELRARRARGESVSNTEGA